MNVPLVDLEAQHREIRSAINSVLGDIIDTSSFIGGRYVEQFERNFAHYCGARFAVACSSGTDAIKLALMGAGVRRDEEVVTVPYTFIAALEAITSIGAHPVFVDIEDSSYHMCSRSLNELLKGAYAVNREGRLENTKSGRVVSAILAVHLYGLPVDMEPISELAHQYDLKIVEDAAQAHGASLTYNGTDKRVGTFGVTAAFSFYPGKNLGAMGEAGAVVTENPECDRWLRVWRDHGQIEKYTHVSPQGWNARLDAMQCAILDLKLRRLDAWNRWRRRAARWYFQRLQEDDRIILPLEPRGHKHVYHLFVVRLPDRDRALKALRRAGIGVGLHYPVPLHLQEAYRDLGFQKGDFPVSERVADSILSLPIYPHITEEQVNYVCRELEKCLD